MIFLTVGTQFPFDRLVRAVDKAAGDGQVPDPVFAQVGVGGYRPEHFQSAEQLDRAEFARRVRESKAVVGHAGMGTILSALEAGKPLLVMPRLKRFREAVNDHQVAMARRFADSGYLLMARDEGELPRMLAALDSFAPARRSASAEGVIRRVRQFLADVADFPRADGGGLRGARSRP